MQLKKEASSHFIFKIGVKILIVLVFETTDKKFSRAKTAYSA